MDYTGHKREDGAVQPLKAHLEGVAALTAHYADAFGAAEHGRRTGLLHDVGKYAPDVQRRMNDPAHTAKVNHTSAGAQAAFGLSDLCAAFAIAGHHGGLADMGAKGDGDQSGTLRGKLSYKPQDYSAYQNEIHIKSSMLTPKWATSALFPATFYTRMLFSCLVDADFIDTETFMQGQAAMRGEGDSLPVLLERLRAHVSGWFPPKNALNAMRCEILEACARHGEGGRGLYTLTVPTGGGKTVASLAFALTHAVRHGMKRIIYVVPYTSIIDQNADVFRGIVGDENILEHHSGVEYDEKEGEDEDAALRKKRLATENWDAPIVVTTAVQFFESLYASKTSKCRKLHNIAGSVVIFDEAQMMPVPYLEPCVAAISELVSHYGATAVLCTATQPALDGLFSQFCPDMPISEIIPGREALFEAFKRVVFRREGTLADGEIAARLGEAHQVLCIVNTRRRARALYDLLKGEGVYHLSTFMTPQDRRAALVEIRKRLEDGKVCRVVATSLIEAGVDVDFPAVWREAAGLDSILQAAGRCNREGRRKREDSIVHVFSTEGIVPRMFELQVEAARAALQNDAPFDSLDTIRAYFNWLLLYKRGDLDQKKILPQCDHMAFRTIGQAMKLIDTDTVPVIIPCAENADMVRDILAGECSKKLLRKLQRYAVNVYERQYNALCDMGKVQRLDQWRMGVLMDESAYVAGTGLSLACDPGEGLFA